MSTFFSKHNLIKPLARKPLAFSIATLCCSGFTGPLSAGTFETGIVSTYQASTDDRSESEFSTSLDVVFSSQLGPGELQVHIEASTTPRNGGVGSLVPDANADLGSALGGNGDGRVQISELTYNWSNSHASYTLGLIDATGFMDSSAVANDEGAQFLAGPLVNNPTIQFPDYSLGGVVGYQRKPDHPHLHLILTNSHGLGDNPKASYSELVDLNDTPKGIFLGAELEWEGTTSYRVGTWTNTAYNANLSGVGGGTNYGVYGVIDNTKDQTHWTVRAGMANEKVSQTAWFLSSAIDHEFTSFRAGLGIALSAASDKLAASADHSIVSELYSSHKLGAAMHISPHIQYHKNPGFDSSNTTTDDSQWIGGVRLSIAF